MISTVTESISPTCVIGKPFMSDLIPDLLSTMRVLALIAVSLYVIFQSIRVCAGGAVLKAHMVSFQNSQGRDIDNVCCDLACLSPCDHFFTFCFDDDDPARQWNIGACYPGTGKTTGEFMNKNVIRFDHNMEGINNPIVMRFYQWKGSVRMKVKVMDDDTGHSSHDEVDEIFYTYSGIPGRTSGSPNIQQHDLPGQRSNKGVPPTILSVKFELYCEPDFYGTACDVECVPRDDDRGHYICDPDTGDIVCMEGWEGVACTVRADDCHQHDCQNGATCQDGDKTYTCVCPGGFSGRFCETDIDECESDPCYNGATCRNLPGRFVCECPRSFTGPFCQHDICVVKDPCQNGGSCYDDGKCFCPPAYTGKHCTENTCDVIKCENGGTCMDGVCICPPGFLGTYCTVNACVPKECYNGGVCQRGRCMCLPGFTGSGCEGNINDCESLPCQHWGHCVDIVNGYKCICQKPYSGVNCEVVTGTESPKSERYPYVDKAETPDVAESMEKTTDVNILPIAVGVGACVLLLLIILLVALLVLARRRRKRRQAGTPPGSPGDQFENPTYSDLAGFRNGDAINSYPGPPHGDPSVTDLGRDGQPMVLPPSYDSHIPIGVGDDPYGDSKPQAESLPIKCLPVQSSRRPNKTALTDPDESLGACALPAYQNHEFDTKEKVEFDSDSDEELPVKKSL